MTVYAQPGTDGSKVTFKDRYENWIGGEWVAPVKGQYFENITPVTTVLTRMYHPSRMLRTMVTTTAPATKIAPGESWIRRRARNKKCRRRNVP